MRVRSTTRWTRVKYGWPETPFTATAPWRGRHWQPLITPARSVILSPRMLVLGIGLKAKFFSLALSMSSVGPGFDLGFEALVGLPDLPYFTGDPVFQTLSPASQWGWASAIWQLDSLFDTERIVGLWRACSIKRSGVRPSVCPSVSLSHQSNAAAACGGFAAERRTRKRYRSTAPGARQQ